MFSRVSVNLFPGDGWVFMSGPMSFLGGLDMSRGGGGYVQGKGWVPTPSHHYWHLVVATEAGGTHPTGMLSCYCPQWSCEGYVFTGACLSTGGCVVSQHALPCKWYSSMPCSRSPGGGVISQHALQVVSQHALQQVSRGVGCLVWGVCSQGGTWSGGSASRGLLPGGGSAPRGVCSQGGAWSEGLLPGGGLVSQHALRQTPRERRLLLRTVRIPLECILVPNIFIDYYIC